MRPRPVQLGAPASEEQHIYREIICPSRERVNGMLEYVISDLVKQPAHAQAEPQNRCADTHKGDLEKQKDGNGASHRPSAVRIEHLDMRQLQ